MSINAILDFIKAFIKWQDTEKPFKFEVLSQHSYKSGLLLRVSRASVTNRLNASEVSTIVWISKNKSRPYLFIFLDSLEGLGIRNLSHRIQILISERHLTEDSVKVNILLSQSYYLGNNAQANSIILKLISYCQSRNYDSVDFNWEIEQLRKQVLGYYFTKHTQSKAREDYRYSLDRYEMRHIAPSTINPVVLYRLTDLIEPKVTPKPKSRIIELILVGCLLVGIAWFVFR